MAYIDILMIAGSILLGLIIGLYLIRQRQFDEKHNKIKAEKLLTESELNSKALLEQAKVKAVETKEQFKGEEKEFVAQLDRMERGLTTKNALLQKREAKVAEVRSMISEEEKGIRAVRSKIEEIDVQVDQKLIKITGLSHEKAKEQLLHDYEQAFANDAEARLQKDMQWAEECSVRDAKNLLAETICRFGDPTSVEHEYKNITVPRDEIKGRIVGRGARNIAFFENLFGVDVVFNDEPNIIILGCFNLVQREIARFALERLMREKIINEEVISRLKPLAEQDMDKLLRREGEQILKLLNLEKMPPDFAKLVGRLQFRTSYGQNILRHSLEVGYFARMLAGAVGADEHIAFIGGFFHDIGKAIDQEVGGSHDVLSKEILEKYGFSKEIVHAAWTHHDAAPIETVEALTVKAADALSAGRPGARAESLERYLQKIKDLQETALSFAGVKKAYAINAGREVRVIVDPDKINDKSNQELATQIASKVEEKGGYPGKIKVVTIRTTKVTDYAK
jgi:ribonuclease Y